MKQAFQIRNQFLLTKSFSEDLDKNVCTKYSIGDFKLYASSDLNVSSCCIDENREIVVIGFYFHCEFPGCTMSELLSRTQSVKTLENVLEFLSELSGVFLTFFRSSDTLYVIPDACAMRECFFSNQEVASSPKLLKHVATEKDSLADEFYGSDEFRYKMLWVGSHTNFPGIRRLKPNHYIKLGSYEMIRFFPLKPLTEEPVHDIAHHVKKTLVGTFQALVEKEKIMIGLTAGWDSRLLLAASKTFAPQIQYFLLCHKHSKTDAQISRAIATRHNLNYFQQWYSLEPLRGRHTEKLKEVLANFDDNLPALTNIAKFYNDRISVSGAGAEIARIEFGRIRNVTADILINLSKQPKHKFVEREYQRWLDNTAACVSKAGYDPLDFFYWEEVVANKTAKSLAESFAFGMKIFPIFNNHLMLTKMLAVSEKYRQKQNNWFYTQAIKELWPQLLSFPINPHPKKSVIRIMQRVGVYDLYRTFFPQGIVKSVLRR